MAENLRDQYARGLLALGYKRVEGRTSRYWVFHHEGEGPDAWIFLGKAGAVRYNSIQRIDGSFSAGAIRKAGILRKGQK